MCEGVRRRGVGWCGQMMWWRLTTCWGRAGWRGEMGMGEGRERTGLWCSQRA